MTGATVTGLEVELDDGGAEGGGGGCAAAAGAGLFPARTPPIIAPIMIKDSPRPSTVQYFRRRKPHIRWGSCSNGDSTVFSDNRTSFSLVAKAGCEARIGGFQISLGSVPGGWAKEPFFSIHAG